MRRYPEKENVFKFYIKRPIEAVDHKLKRLTYKIKMKLGYWYCGKCNTYHTARTVKYDYSNGEADYICSLGLQELEEHGCSYERVKI